MVLIISPAIDGLKRDWREAAENMGASTFQYWRHVALAMLIPSLLGSTILLIANAFGAQATAYQLTGGSIDIAAGAARFRGVHEHIRRPGILRHAPLLLRRGDHHRRREHGADGSDGLLGSAAIAAPPASRRVHHAAALRHPACHPRLRPPANLQ